MKTVSSLVAAAALAASVASPVLAGPLRGPDRPADPVQTVQNDWRDYCRRGESQSECRRRLDYENRRSSGYGDRRDGYYSGGYGSGYSGGSYGSGYSGGGYSQDPRYYDRGGYYEQYVRPGGSYGSGGYGTGYGSGGYYGNGYGSGGYYGGGSGYGSGGYGYGPGYGSGYSNGQLGDVALAVLGVALGVAIIGDLDDRDHWDRNRDDRRYGDYCRGRYRSFDRDSGTYLGNDGYRHYCRWN